MCPKRASHGQNAQDAEESTSSALNRFKHGQRAYHGRLRRQQHNVAQLEHQGQDREAVPEHPLIPAGPPELVATQAALDEAIGHLRQAGGFAYDTEFIGELTYYPQLCLVQLATTQRVILVDPLAKLDLQPLWALIAEPEVETIVHAGPQDLEPVVRHLGRPPARVVDTQLAAGFVGLPYPLSLRELVRELVGASLSKGATFTEWDRRPLAPMQLEYAADDVRYLPATWSIIRGRLEKTGHTAWALAECATLCQAEAYAFNLDAQVLRVKGSGAMSGRKAAVLRALVAVRDHAARQQDVPPRALLRDEVLVGLAKRQPASRGELAAVSGLPRPIERAYGEQLLQAMREGQQAPAPDMSEVRRPPEPPAERIAVDSLWALTQSVCHSQAVDPALVASRQDIRRFLAGLDRPAAAGDSVLMQGWRRQLVGEVLRDFVAAKRRVTLRWESGRLKGPEGS